MISQKVINWTAKQKALAASSVKRNPACGGARPARFRDATSQGAEWKLSRTDNFLTGKLLGRWPGRFNLEE
jgi:hypothetical protein